MSKDTTGNKMWGGRFASGPDAIMEEINASIDFDQKLYTQDIGQRLKKEPSNFHAHLKTFI